MDWTEAPALRRKLPANGHSPEPTATAPVADSTRRSGRQEEQGDILGALEFASGVPAGAVEQEEGMGTGRDLAGNLAQVGLHGMGIGPGQGKRCPSAARGADGAEEVEALIALVLGLVRPCAFLGPLPHQAVLLAQAHLVLPPKLDRRPGRQMADCGG